MVSDQEPASPQRSASSDIAIKHDRRRPGRVEVNPALIPLLRGTAPLFEPLPSGVAARSYTEQPYTKQSAFDFGIRSDPAAQDWLRALDDGGNPGRGIVLGSLLLLPLWAVTAACYRWLLG